MSFFLLNTTSHSLNYEDKVQRSFLKFVIVINMFILTLGLLGNVLVIYFFLTNIKLRNVRNAFMVNLTVSNILLLAICTPSFLLSLIIPSWTHGGFWCKFSHAIQIVFVLVCAFSIMMIAIDRWMFVVFSRSRQLSTRDSLLIIIAMWFLATILSAPTFFHRLTRELYDDSFKSMINSLAFSKLNSFQQPPQNLTVNMSTSLVTSTSLEMAAFNLNTVSFDLENLKDNINSNNIIYCVEEWPNPINKRVYILILFTLEFVLPCIVILITYIWIIRFLHKNDQKMSHYEMLRKKLIQKERPHQKNCKLLSSLCITFIICYLPLSVFNIKTEFIISNDKAEKEIYSPLTVLTTLEVLNTVASPLLYGWMNHNFRQEINQKMKIFKNQYRKVNAFSIRTP